MSEVELQSIYSRFNQAKTEYIQLLSKIKTTCLGDTLSQECSRANTLNAEMQTCLAEMSNVKTPTHQNQEKLVYITQQLRQDNTQLKALETSKALENDSQVLATMNYNRAVLWCFACITIVLLLFHQSLILFFGCIIIGFLLYYQLWFLACIMSGFLFCYFASA